MPSRARVLEAFDRHGDFREVGTVLGVPPGQAYLIGSGLPADGSDSFPESDLDRPGLLPGSTQHLVYAGIELENPAAKPRVLEWMKRRAAQDTEMAAAGRARDAAPGGPPELEGADVSTVITRDHDRVSALLKQLKAIPGVTKGGSPRHLSRRKSLVELVTTMLNEHEAAEQKLLWPAVRSASPNGDEVVERALAQEEEAQEVLTELGQLAAEDEQFDELVEQLDQLVRKHVAFEDKVLLALGEAMSDDEQRAFGRELARAERGTPARPHGGAPAAPAAAPGAGRRGAAKREERRA